MDRKSNIEVFKLRTLERSEHAPQIRLMSMNTKTNNYEYVANIDGAYGLFSGNPDEEREKNIVSFYLNLPTERKGDRSIWEYELPIATDAYLLHVGNGTDEAGMTARDYQNNKEIITLLKKHRQVIWKEGTLNNKNTNIKSDIVSYELVNTTAAIIVKSKIDDLSIEAAYQLKQWRENDNKTYLNFCYLWGMKNLEAFTQEALSSAITFMVQKDVSKYQKVLSWINDEIRINVYKGMATLERAEDNKEAKEIISRESGYYTFNKDLVGANHDEVVNYFKTHPQAYDLLKMYLGVKEKVEVELKSEPKVNLNDNLANSTTPAQEQEKEKAKFLTQIETKLNQVKNGKNILADKIGNAYPLIDGIITTIEDVVNNLAKTEMVVKYGFERVYWTKAFELGLTKTLKA
jgi:hypothetical protein